MQVRTLLQAIVDPGERDIVLADLATLDPRRRVPMNTVSCPNCGAPVTFRSAASVMAVCGFCQSTLVKDADAVRNIGRMADVLEDFSPIQINTSGTIDGRGFTVVGRIQLRYPAGFWNEWYVLDDHGEGAWLSDGSGQYTFTRGRRRCPMSRCRPSSNLAPGAPLDLGRAPDGSTLLFIAGDVRAAQCTGGQGELPFTVGAGYAARVADFRRGNEFLTLDYSDDKGGSAAGRPDGLPRPLARARRDEAAVAARPRAITDAAGRVKGKVTNLECPSCGASIAFSPGATSHLLCQTCHASLDVAGPVAEVLAAAKRVDAVVPTLPLGATGTIAAAQYTVIGFMRRAEIGEGGEWTEYLLYAPQRGFLWLVETDEGWERAQVLDTWPFWYTADQALLGGETYRKLYDYQAVVKYAAGAFNWRVEVGDVNQVTEFQSGNAKLAAESDDSELNWSRSTPVSAADLTAWFGKQVDTRNVPSGPPSLVGRPAGGYRQVAKWLTILLLAVNAIPILFSPGRALVIVILATIGLYFPAWMMDKASAEKV